MQENFQSEVMLLKQIETKELYRLFHKMQFDTLKPQWDVHKLKLLGESVDSEVVELFGPRSPELPEWYEGEILQEISKSQKDILILHHVLDFLEDPLEAIQLAQNSGFKTILIHEPPKDASFRYHSNPEIPYFKNRHILAFERHRQAEGNKAIDAPNSQVAVKGCSRWIKLKRH